MSKTPQIPTAEFNLSAPQHLLTDLIESSVVQAEDWDALTPQAREEITGASNIDELLGGLTSYKLLTPYQAGRIHKRDTFGLVMGNYRVLDRIGAGGMAIVFKAEHKRMRRVAAIKALNLCPAQYPKVVTRFLTEVRAIAELNHPNIVSAFDAGELAGPQGETLHYFVLEFVDGSNLEDLVRAEGPLSPDRACDLIHQIASALAETHKHDLVHRDIKPSNVMVTPDGRAKLLDFGLSRNKRQRVTEPGTTMGTIDYLAPEQARNAASVDIRADIYGLGGTMFWCLTGQLPFPSEGSDASDLIRRLHQAPPSIRLARPDLPADLDSVVQRMMALRPEDRYQTPEGVMSALVAFLRMDARARTSEAGANVRKRGEGQRLDRILIVDDDANVRNLCTFALQGPNRVVEGVGTGEEAWLKICEQERDLVLLDVDLPGVTGPDILRRLREGSPRTNTKVIMCSGRVSTDEMAEMLLAGADDFVAKPFSIAQIRARVQTALRLKLAQDDADALRHQMQRINEDLARTIDTRDAVAFRGTVRLLSRFASQRGIGGHPERVQRLTHAFLDRLQHSGTYGDLSQSWRELLETCVPIRDVGMIALPDAILHKAGKLDLEERLVMQSHPMHGSDVLDAVGREHGFAAAQFRLAAELVRHHHEHWNGTGYPDGLRGTDIPLPARIVALVDVYDALRSRRVFRPPFSHATAIQVMRESTGHFDPKLQAVFEGAHEEMDAVFRETSDG